MSGPVLDVAACHTVKELMTMASAWEAYYKPTEIEYNGPAHQIMELEIAAQLGRPAHPKVLMAYAEESMLTLAFLNMKINPTAGFITLAYHAGWRFRPGAKGFYKEK